MLGEGLIRRTRSESAMPSSLFIAVALRFAKGGHADIGRAGMALAYGDQGIRLARLLKRERIRILHLNNSITRNHTWTLGALLARLPCVTHERGINERYASTLGSTRPTAHFVIDTSRNGQGPWPVAAGTYPDNQDWCNPPGRGLGERPTTRTGHPLLDAKLWVKTPGQSDGQCTRGIPGGTTDPEWGGITDPAAGAWFPQQALQLARLASPPLLPR